VTHNVDEGTSTVSDALTRNKGAKKKAASLVDDPSHKSAVSTEGQMSASGGVEGQTSGTGALTASGCSGYSSPNRLPIPLPSLLAPG
jgi:hypothetical protein